MDTIRRAAPPACASALSGAVASIDAILLGAPRLAGALKALFGLRGLRDDRDFAALLEVRGFSGSVPPAVRRQCR